MDINAVKPKLKRMFLIPAELTDHFYLVTNRESAALVAVLGTQE